MEAARVDLASHRAVLVRFLLRMFRAGSDGTQQTKPDSQGWVYALPPTARASRGPGVPSIERGLHV
jgi:hypothetical protein